MDNDNDGGVPLPTVLKKIRMQLSLAPCYTQSVKIGITDRLNALLLRYLPSLQGVFLAYSNVALPTSHAFILHESPYLHCHITFQALLFAPVVGQRLSGRVNKVGSHHLGLLCANAFNASIAITEFPPDSYYVSSVPASESAALDTASNYGEEEESGLYGVEAPVSTLWTKTSAAITRERQQKKRAHKEDTFLRMPETITTDTLLTFVVVAIHEANGILSIEGSLLPQRTSLQSAQAHPSDNKDPNDAVVVVVKKVKKAKKKRSQDPEVDVERVSGSAARPSGKRKKSKKTI